MKLLVDMNLSPDWVPLLAATDGRSATGGRQAPAMHQMRSC